MPRDEYFDYAYAAKVWDTLQTLAALDAEMNRYAKEFDPWATLFEKDRNAAMAAMRAAKPGSALQRGYDAQLAYDAWRNFTYEPWRDMYQRGAIKENFETNLARKNSVRAAENMNSPTCKRRGYLGVCGILPDWRSAEDKKADAAMMAEADRKYPVARGK